jgi:hypothetical protein
MATVGMRVDLRDLKAKPNQHDMKTLTQTFALFSLVFGILVTSAIAENPSKPSSPIVRCPSCGAHVAIKIETKKDQAIEMKLEKVTQLTNPKAN